jgi:hypothetical protein
LFAVKEITMRQFTTILLILCFVTILNGCKDSSDSSKGVPQAGPNVSEPNITKPNDSTSSKIPAIPPADIFEITGTVVYKGLEGGFFAIDGDNGSKYDPISLPESFKKDGLKVKVTARLRKDAMSIHMYGSIIEIVNIAGQ